ncbi:MAG TPA: hypothetical protein VHQ93_00540 [Chitinophagaceae bacterium]|jgi:hypothetical protein|nr:hypothetical protein [Chitinophagaceae bacterium]
MAIENTSWNLEDFVDSLVVELDKTRETLAIKAINKPLTYTVKDMAMDINIFPTYDGEQVKFVTAQPGQTGASKVTIQLGSITDQQVRATSKIPGLKKDINIYDIDVDKKTKKQLRKMGVTSVDDIKQIENKNIDLGKASDNAIDYTRLANQIQKSRRNINPPVVKSVSLSVDENKKPVLVVSGKNLAVDPKFKPVAVVNQALAEVRSHDEDKIEIRLDKSHGISNSNELVLTFDPFAIMKLNIKA